MFNLPDLNAAIQLDLKPMTRRFDEAQREARNFSSRFSRQMSGLGRGIADVGVEIASMGARLAAVGVGAGAAGLAGLAAWSVKLAADAEQTQVSFGVMLGSAEKAKQLVAEINAFAAATPFQVTQLNDATKKLLAFGTAQDQIIPTMRTLGDVAAGLNIPIGELSELYGKARVSGRLMAEDVNQLTGRGIPVIQEFAKQFGVAESEIKKMVESGQVNFSHLQTALVSLTGEGGKFAGLMAAQSATLAGKFSTLRDAVELNLTAIGTMITDKLDLSGAIDGISAGISAMAASAMPLLGGLSGGLGESGDVATRVSNAVMSAAEMMATGIAHVNDGIHLLIAGFKGLQLGGVLAFKAVIDGAIVAGDAIVSTINQFSEWTGVEVKKTGILDGLSAGLAEDAAKLKTSMSDAFEVFDEGNGPKRVARFFEEVRNQAKKTSDAMAAGAKLDALGQVSPTLGGVGSIVTGAGGGLEGFKKMLGDTGGMKIDAAVEIDAGGLTTEMKAMQADVDKFRESLKGPIEQYDEAIERLRAWRDEQRITEEEFSRGVAAAKDGLEKSGPKQQEKNFATQLPEFIRFGSAEHERRQFQARREAGQPNKDEVPKRQLDAALRQEDLLSLIAERLDFKVA